MWFQTEFLLRRIRALGILHDKVLAMDINEDDTTVMMMVVVVMSGWRI